MSNTAQSLASKRITSLLDENSFVEIGAAVRPRNTDFNMLPADAPADGVMTGYGVIDNNLVYVYSQDASVLGGSIGEMHAKKIMALYDMAMKMGAPVIGLIDCAGLRLQEGTDSLNAFGAIYQKQALASGVIPQITAVFGNCGGGLAVLAGLSDFTFMEEKHAKLFVNSPNALEGNRAEKCDTASAKFQSEEAGLVDFTGSEEELFGKIRDLVTMIPANNEDHWTEEECTDDLNRLCTDVANAVGDVASLLSQIADNHFFLETKAAYAKDIVTGFLRLNGQTVGAIANGKDLLTGKGAEKAAAFAQFCDAFDLPILTLTNVKGFETTMESETTIAKAAAKLTHAFADATVPKVNVVMGSGYGSAFVVMNSKSIGADMTFAWPTAQIGTMEAGLAAKIMYADADADTLKEKADEYASLQTSASSAAARGYVDTIMEPADTRKYVIGAFEMLYSKMEEHPAKKHGTV